MSLSEVTDRHGRRGKKRNENACRTRSLHEGTLNCHLNFRPNTNTHLHLRILPHSFARQFVDDMVKLAGQMWAEKYSARIVQFKGPLANIA